MRIAAYQFPVTGNIRDNLNRIRSAILQAAEAGVRLLVCPECALTGYPPRDLLSSAAVDFAALDEAHEDLQALSDRHQMYLIVGTMTETEHGIQNTARIIRPGQPALLYHKRALWGWDQDNFVPGTEPGIVELDGLRIGVRICYELRFPEYFRELYHQKTNLNVILFYDVSERDDKDRYDLIRGHIRTRAVENVCPTLSVNAVKLRQTAPTMQTDASGTVLVEAERGREVLIVFDLGAKQPDFGERGRKELSDQLLASAGDSNPEFWAAIDALVSRSEIVIDRPKGSAHPRFPDFIYQVDYGYLKDTASMDGAGIDVWVGSGENTVDAVMCIVDLMKRDSEIKILIGCTEEEKQIVYETHNESPYMKGVMIRRTVGKQS